MRLKHLSLLLAIMALFITLPACNHPDEPDDPWENNSPGNSNNNGSSSLSWSEIQQIVKQNVTTKCSYKNYTLTFTIESTLHQKLNGYDIKYGIGHKTTFSGDEIMVQFGSSNYKYSQRYVGNKSVIEIQVPFYYYYILGDRDLDTGGELEFYYRSYRSIVDMGLSNVDSSTRDLYYNIVDIFNDHEPTVKRYYRPCVVVDIDDRSVFLQSYQL